MTTLYLTLVAVIVYFVSDWLLQRVEIQAGRRLESRSLLFFGVFLTLLLASFAAVRLLAPS